jgi:hypothetical protein
MRMLAKLFVGGIVLFAALQWVRPRIPVKPAIAELLAPPTARRCVEKDGLSCHSDEKRLSWFIAGLVPARLPSGMADAARAARRLPDAGATF